MLEQKSHCEAEVSMTDNHGTITASRNLEKALQALEQAKQRVANEKKNGTRKSAKPRTTTSISWAVLS